MRYISRTALLVSLLWSSATLLSCGDVETQAGICTVGQVQDCSCGVSTGTQTCLQAGGNIFWSDCTACVGADVSTDPSGDDTEPGDSSSGVDTPADPETDFDDDDPSTDDNGTEDTADLQDDSNQNDSGNDDVADVGDATVLDACGASVTPDLRSALFQTIDECLVVLADCLAGGTCDLSECVLVDNSSPSATQIREALSDDCIGCFVETELCNQNRCAADCGESDCACQSCSCDSGCQARQALCTGNPFLGACESGACVGLDCNNVVNDCSDGERCTGGICLLPYPNVEGFFAGASSRPRSAWSNVALAGVDCCFDIDDQEGIDNHFGSLVGTFVVNLATYNVALAAQHNPSMTANDYTGFSLDGAVKFNVYVEAAGIPATDTNFDDDFANWAFNRAFTVGGDLSGTGGRIPLWAPDPMGVADDPLRFQIEGARIQGLVSLSVDGNVISETPIRIGGAIGAQNMADEFTFAIGQGCPEMTDVEVVFSFGEGTTPTFTCNGDTTAGETGTCDTVRTACSFISIMGNSFDIDLDGDGTRDAISIGFTVDWVEP